MKTLLIGSLLLTSTATYAQSIDLNALKNLMTSKKESLEKINPGMAKKTIINAKEGQCGTMTTLISTVVKVEAEHIIVHETEKFQSQNTQACRSQGVPTSSTSAVLYYAEKPSLTLEISDIEAFGSDLKSISRTGDVITMNIVMNDTNENGTPVNENLTIQNDLNKSAFKYQILNQGLNHKTTTQDMPDTNLSTLDLKNIAFCESVDSDPSTCMTGDWSDLLF